MLGESVQPDKAPRMEDILHMDSAKDLELLQEGKKETSTEDAISVHTGYPKEVYVLVVSMLCEHLCESGLKSLMAQYFHTMLGLEGNLITVAMHSFNFLQYFAVLFGACLADSFFGRANVVLWSQCIYSVGTLLLAVSSFVKRAFPSRVCLILALIAKIVGLGGILPCLIPLAADQISDPLGSGMVKRMFTFYFVSVQFCNIVSVLFVPLMKEVPCFGLETCYPLALAFPALLSIIALLLFLSVCCNCSSAKPKRPIVLQGIQCVFYALRNKFSKRKEITKDHWLDYADDIYDSSFIVAVKRTINVLSIPIPIYWSLYDQQVSTWTMQASRMDNEVGYIRVVPGQFQALCPTLLLLFIPLFHTFLYDLLTPLKIFTTLLRRMIVGGFLISLAFWVAFFVELGIERSYPHIPRENEAVVNIFNGFNTEVNMTIGLQNSVLKTHSFCKFTFKLKETSKEIDFEYNFNRTSNRGKIVVKKLESPSYIFAQQFGEKLTKICDNYETSRDSSGLVKVRLLCSHEERCSRLRVSLTPEEWFLKQVRSTSLTEASCSGAVFRNVFPGKYVANVAGVDSGYPGINVDLKTGGIYALLVDFDRSCPRVTLLETGRPNSVSVLWLLPQYLLLALSSVLFTISAYSFIYTETPAVFKSFSWSACYMTLSAGNMVTVLVGGAPLSASQNFLLFAILMLFGMMLFLYAAHTYRYNNESNISKSRIYPFH